MSLTPALRRSVAGSLGAGLAIQGCLIVSGVVVARMLGVHHRGEFALMTLFPAVLTSLGGLGVPTAITYFVAKHPDGAGSITRSVAPWYAVQTALLTVLHAAIVSQVFVSVPYSTRLAAWITIVTVPAIMSQQLGLSILQGLEKFRVFEFVACCTCCTLRRRSRAEFHRRIYISHVRSACVVMFVGCGCSGDPYQRQTSNGGYLPRAQSRTHHRRIRLQVSGLRPFWAGCRR